MEPAFYRGDVLYLTNYPDEPLEVGDIVVFKVENRDIPIVHRIIKLHKRLASHVQWFRSTQRFKFLMI